MNPHNHMGCKELPEMLDRLHGYASIPDNPFRSMILYAFFANIPRIQVFLYGLVLVLFWMVHTGESMSGLKEYKCSRIEEMKATIPCGADHARSAQGIFALASTPFNFS
ncbi:MAG: hypothetical protein JJU29_04845 [Verrucomicrobia bacterium]|nr:hypothetical protein [Verrucomicrobiota bacterium]MCH8510264.1 hypothetical protein [Kiritimatiellia bacterium]